MHAGDKLVNKIFEEGIKNAQAMVIVLSKFSVNKPWVREELNAGMVRRIENNTKLIPILIDDCQVPECLRSTVWVKIKDINNYEAELESIVMSIYGKLDKPPLGQPPSYAKTVIDIVPGLTELDSLILKEACEMAVQTGSPFIHTDKLLPQVESHEIHRKDFFESLEILDHRGYIGLVRPMSVDPPAFTIKLFGFEEYARVYVSAYEAIVNSVASRVINQQGGDERLIASSLNQPKIIIQHVLKVLANRGLIRIFEGNGGFVIITGVSPELKRVLSQG